MLQSFFVIHYILVFIMGFFWGLLGTWIFRQLSQRVVSMRRKCFYFILFTMVTLFVGQFSSELLIINHFLVPQQKIIILESKEINLYQSSLDICMMRGMEGLLNKNLASASAAVRQVNMNVKQIDSLRNQDASEAATLNTLDK